jgi:hypothetical protein
MSALGWVLRECHEEVADNDGQAGPCDLDAVGWRIDPDSNHPYPVCASHHRWPYADKWVAAEAALERVRALADQLTASTYDDWGGQAARLHGRQISAAIDGEATR